MKTFKRILNIVLLAAWTLFFILGIAGSVSGGKIYTVVDACVLLGTFLFPLMIWLIVRNRKRKKKREMELLKAAHTINRSPNKQVLSTPTEEFPTEPIFTPEDFQLEIELTIETEEDPYLAQADNLTQEQKNNITFVDGHPIKLDGTQITDEEVPYIIKKPGEYTMHLVENNIIKNKWHDLSPDEAKFFSAFGDLLNKNGLDSSQIRFKRLSNKSFNVDYGYICYVGKIKLAGRKTYMQILENLYDIDTPEHSTLEEYIAELPRWVKYTKWAKREHDKALSI